MYSMTFEVYKILIRRHKKFLTLYIILLNFITLIGRTKGAVEGFNLRRAGSTETENGVEGIQRSYVWKNLRERKKSRRTEKQTEIRKK